MKHGAKNRSNTRKILNNNNVHARTHARTHTQHHQQQQKVVLASGWTVLIKLFKELTYGRCATTVGPLKTTLLYFSPRGRPVPQTSRRWTQRWTSSKPWRWSHCLHKLDNHRPHWAPSLSDAILNLWLLSPARASRDQFSLPPVSIPRGAEGVWWVVCARVGCFQNRVA